MKPLQESVSTGFAPGSKPDVVTVTPERSRSPNTVRVIDSHTAGEPTRVVVTGGPDLGAGPLTERCELFRREFDRFRSSIALEPRGSDALVGALLVEPHEPDCLAGAVFFNNVGTLSMCGHATVGLTITLAHLGRIRPGLFRLDTQAGVVGVEYHGGARVSVANVPSYRLAHDLRVDVPGVGQVCGDLAWGGNWFFLTRAPDGGSIGTRCAPRLTDYATRVMNALAAAGVTGPLGERVDHVELVGPPVDSRNHARNFVLCPGGAYDRSPCGTGTSAKLACLAADGRLNPGETWRQEGIAGGVFEASYSPLGDGRIAPRITGEAFVTADSTLIFHPDDPFRWGIRE